LIRRLFTQPQLLLLLGSLALGAAGCGGSDDPPGPNEAPERESLPEIYEAEVGRPGGRLVAALRAEPSTLNPVIAADRPSKKIRHLTHGDLIHINRQTQKTEPALARSWSVSEDERRYTLELRDDVLFSDGEPFDADDVLFSFEVYLDPEVGSTNRALLTVQGEPIRASKLDQHSVVFELAAPYAAGERLFDSVAMLPHHLLGASYENGTLAQAWGLGTPPELMAGLGPFRPGSYRPGESLTLERNPHYWRTDAAGQTLPYVDELVLRFVPSQDAETIRFQNGEIDVISGMSAENYAALEPEADAGGYQLWDLGPGLGFEFLFFNLNDLSGTELDAIETRQSWYRQTDFRRAISEAADRESIARLVFEGRATPLGGPVTSGDRLWQNKNIHPPARSHEAARERLGSAGFTWDEQGRLLDAEDKRVEYTLVTNSSNTQRIAMANILREDLRQLGMEVQVVPLEFQSLVQRVLETHDFDAVVFGLGGGDTDPNSPMSVWLSSGSRHLWAPAQQTPATDWEAEIDDLMIRQQTETDPTERKRMYDRVQEILADQLPLIFLISPNVLAGADRDLRNFHPAILEPSALWNAAELFWSEDPKNSI
jgi:peptide/nickel transport system substrate-binding protein